MKHPRAFSREDWLAFTLPWLGPLLATGLGMLLLPVVPVANLALVYLGLVLVTAVATRWLPALFSAVLSFLAYNLFLTEPRWSFAMRHDEDVLTAVMLVVVAVITSHLAGRLKEQVTALRAAEAWNALQVDCARELSACVDPSCVADTLSRHLRSALGWHVRTLELSEMDASEVPVAELQRGVVWREDRAGVSILLGDDRGRAVAGLRVSAAQPVSDWHRDRLDVLARVARLAWGRVQLAESLREETLGKEREQLRAALLSSVSHDLRTPLSSMIGSVSSLIDLADSLDSEQRRELLGNTLSEARRLDRYIQKLLDMTRLGHGELTLDRDWVGVDDIVSVVLRRLQPLLDKVEIKLELPTDLPLLYVHPALIEQALFNVLENALRFSPPEGRIWLSVEHTGDSVSIDVRDSGPGIPPAQREQVFDMFHTFSHGDQYAAGSGLGLAICRSILAAHGGTVEVLDNPPGQGALLRMTLPLVHPPRGEEEM